MLLKIYRVLLMLQIVGITIAGYLLFQMMGIVVGFVAGVLIAGHFLTVLNTRNISAENTKILKNLLEEMKKVSSSQENSRLKLTSSKSE
jgi:preprotein translocase subunit SecF